MLLWREIQKKPANSQWAKAKAYTKTTTMRMKRKGVDSGNVGQKKKKKGEKVAMVANRLDVGSEKGSG